MSLREQVYEHMQNNLNTNLKYYLNSAPIPNIDDETFEIKAPNAFYITTIASSYFIGTPVTYTTNEEEERLRGIVEVYNKQSKKDIDLELATDCSIYGKAYELVYTDDGTQSITLTPERTFISYTETIPAKEEYAVHYYFDREENDNKIYRVLQYTDDTIKEYDFLYKSNLEECILTELRSNTHYFKEIPIIKYKNTKYEKGDYERVKSLIDALNLLQSDRLRDIQRHIDSALILKGVKLGNTEDEVLGASQTIRKTQVIEVPTDGDVNYLTNTLDQSQVQTFKDDIKKAIHEYSLVPNLTDENFANNSSGVAMKYKLFGLDQLMDLKEPNFTKGLLKRLRLYSSVQVTINDNGVGITPIDTGTIKVTYGRSLPSNDLEIAQMIATLSPTAVVSKKTLSKELSFVDDPEKEVEEASKELSTTDYIPPSVDIE